MPMVQVGTSGKVTLEDNTLATRAQLVDLSAQLAFAAANLIRNTIIEGMAGPKSGRTYRVPGTRRTYTASAPGEFPAIPTGRLRNSVRVFVKKRRGSIEGAVGSNTDHGIALEFKDPQRGGRPWLSMGWEQSRGDVQDILERGFKQMEGP